MVMTATIESRARAFRQDNQGAIMVLGIFFACMMIGWMWMVIGLGDAMIWRDRSQEAADAITYSSSALQAKAMNLISFINIIMLVIAFFYMIMAFIWNFLDVAHVVFGSTDDGGCGPTSAEVREGDCMIVSAAMDLSTVLAPVGSILMQFCSKWSNIAGYIEDAHKVVAKVIDPYETMMAKTLPVLSTIEDVAGYGAPWAGEVVGIYIGSQYTDQGKARFGAPLSATLVPGALTPAAAKWNTDTCDKNADATSGSCSKLPSSYKDYRQGLPVEITEEAMSELCYVVGKTVFSSISSLFGGVLGMIVGYIFDGAATSLRDNYCEPDATGYLEGATHTILNDLGPLSLRFATWLQDGGTNNNEQCPHKNWGVDSGGGSDGCGGGPDDCRGVYQIKTDGDNGSNNLWHNRDKAGGPHLVVEYASNGNDWFQVWSFVYGGNRPEQAEKKVGVAGMDSTGPGGVWKKVIPQNSEKAGFFNMYVAQSEFYFDCKGEWKGAECNADFHQASFEMGWRARLRRIKGLSWKKDLFGYFTGGSLGTNFNDFATKWFQIGSKGATTGLLGQFGAFAGNSIISGAFGDVKDKVFDTVGGSINPAEVIPDIIH